MDVQEPVERTPLGALAGAANALAAIALVAMVAVEAWQVFARYVLNDSPGWTEPVALLLLSTAMSMGAAVAVRNNTHFGFFLLAQSAPPAISRGLTALASAIVATIGGVLAIWGTELFVDGLSVPLAGTVLPQSAVFLPMSLGGALIAIFALARVVAILRAPSVPAATSTPN
jgi:TRAP-type C4-dicarboxylate transport system permease small subunit